METKAISNIMYAANSLVVLPSLWEKVDSPFAAISILKRGFIDAYGGWTWSNFWNIVPLSRTYNYIDEIVAASSDKTIREHFED